MNTDQETEAAIASDNYDAWAIHQSFWNALGRTGTARDVMDHLTTPRQIRMRMQIRGFRAWNAYRNPVTGDGKKAG